MSSEFTELNLRPELIQTLTELGYLEPTSIQSALIPTMLTGQDVIGQAQTGTGKTAAFTLPMLHNLQPNQGHIQGLVLAPTRELANQVAKSVFEYGRHLNVRVLAIYGGQSYSRQIRRLKNGVDIVVGTPGRLLDLMAQKALDLSHVSTVVLDEADEMLSMGFVDDIEAILSTTPADRQTALLSATLPTAIRKLADGYMNQPKSFKIVPKQLTVSTIEQRYYLVNEKDKLAALTRLFEVESTDSVLIFTRTRVGANDLANELTTRGFLTEALHGDMSQEARERVLNRFRHHHVNILVATDVAARGLDIDDISHVFNYDLPLDPEVYVHRVGRTGRAGRSGIAISLLSPYEWRHLRKIEQYAKQRLVESKLPTVEAIEYHRQSQLLEQINVWLQRDRCQQEKLLVSQLAEIGHDPLDIAAAALKIARSGDKERPIAPISEVTRAKSRQTRDRNGQRRNGNGNGRNGNRREKGMVRLSLSTGRADGVQVNHVVGALAHFADIPGHSIGKIQIQDQQTLVDVPKQFVQQVLSKTGRYRIGKQRVMVERA